MNNRPNDHNTSNRHHQYGQSEPHDSGEPAAPIIHDNLKHDEIGWFQPRTWAFWRSLTVCLALFSIIGHWMELPYCLTMNHFFGIVSPDYAVWHDPWFVPYWVYGIGAVAMTLVIEPLKEWIVNRRKTLWGAIFESFILMVALAAVLETVIGLIINQPDANGVYPFWDNSVLPGNILNQGWIVNDFFIGLMATVYVWVFYPLICMGFYKLSERWANIVFVLVMIAFALCVIASYTPVFGGPYVAHMQQ
ncbi:putative ABC transporter permease [Bifidobacterium gallicum]|nr:putative ABC transporter permease [Bifidobacterium gallicum]KFI58626.1 membrane protein [Bifidobacterium gallicum DSM 20093 = LMG 11596]